MPQRAAILTALAAAMMLTVSGSALAQAGASARVAGGAFSGAAIHIGDVARSLAFYRDALGMQILMQYNSPAAAGTASTKAGAAARPDTVLTYGGGSNPAPMLMLLGDRDPGGPRTISHPFGFARLLFMVPNLEAVSASLTRNGFKPGEIFQAHGITRVMMVTDPDGYTVEIVEAPNQG